jgi:predicted murein hydrolase (TIGR00659 family)
MNLIWILVSTGLTILAYAVGRAVYRRYPSPMTTPVVIAAAALMIVLLASGVDYSVYREGSSGIVALLGPATSALAVPLYRHRRVIGTYVLPAMLALMCGGLATFLAAEGMALAFGLTPMVVHSIGIKSVTTPIAIELAVEIGGDPSLTAAFVVATGMIGALLGPLFLNRFAVRDPVARGLAFGTISQGFGTVQAMTEGELQGAVSGIAMGVTAIIVSLWAPALTRLIT